MGRRKATAVKTSWLNTDLATMLVAGVGFALEVAMIAAFLFWGLRQSSPWNLVLGIGIPAAVVVLWGIFMAPRSERRLPENIVRWAALGVFLVAGVTLLAAGTLVPGVVMLVATGGYFVAERALARS
ncbi:MULTISPECIES: YrdB family protein [Arthrobacter]|uniref:YrdB family protein n=1 Tax=Arthrobacter TaxID=1663 RepID=UPI0012B5C5B1|nr:MULTISPECIES: YrdB family protein [Arthrobacter]